MFLDENRKKIGMFQKLSLSFGLMCATSLVASQGDLGRLVKCEITASEAVVRDLGITSDIVALIYVDDQKLPVTFAEYNSLHVSFLLKNIKRILEVQKILDKNKKSISRDTYTDIKRSIDSYKNSYLQATQEHSELLALRAQQEK